MKTLLISFAIGCMVVGCVTQTQRERICKTCPTNTIIKDSIHVEIKEKKIPFYITDTFNYFLPNPCAELCDSLGNLKPTFKKEIKSNKGTKETLTVKNNQLVLIERIDSLKKVISIKDTSTNNFHYKVIVKPAICNLNHITKWDMFWIKTGRISLAVLFILLGYEIVKFYLKLKK